MSNLLPKYLNARTVCLSTSIWDDANLTVVSADGVYSFGNTVVQLTAGVITILNGGDCPTCDTPCNNSNLGSAYTWSPSLSGVVVPAQAGTFEIASNLGDLFSDTGAVIVRVFLKGDPGNALTDVSAPIGMKAWLQNEGDIVTSTTNMFSGSGTTVVSGNIANGQTVINGPGGTVGATKNINDVNLTSSDFPVFVGRCNNASIPATANCFSSINTGVPAACGGGLTIPNNNPFGGGTAAASVTYTGLPKYSWDWDTDAFVNTATPTDIVVEEQQVQVGGAGGILSGACTPAGEGYRGWLTAVLSRNNVNDNKVLLGLYNTMCQGGAVVNISCPQILSPIECSSPMSSLEQACAVSVINNTLYNVPGASGISGLTPQYVFPAGKPNLGDIMCSNSLGAPLTQAQKNKYYKYLDTDGPAAFYVDNYGVVSETKISCVAGATASFDESIPLEELGIGGGLYRTTWTVPATSTGSVIVRVYTGDNPKGLIVKHYDTDANGDKGAFLGSTNMFSVRGAQLGGVLGQTSYDSRIDEFNGLDTIRYVQSGAIWGGCALTMGSKNAPPGASYAPHFMENAVDWPLPAEQDKWWGMLQTSMAIQDFTYGCQQYGQVDNNSIGNNVSNYPYFCWTPCNSLDETTVAQVDAPVYIGKANFSGSFIPCTSQTLLTVTGSPLACGTNCFNPEGGGAINDSNISGIINLPPNGNHGGTNIEGIGPQITLEDSNPPLPEAIFLKTNLCIVYPDAGNGTLQEDFEGTFPPATRFPDNTTGCTQGGLYNLWTLSVSGGYTNVGDSRRFYITPDQVQLYSPSELASTTTTGWSMAVIPLTGAIPANQIIDLDIYIPSSNASFIVYADSPAALPQTSFGGAPLTLYGPYPLTSGTSGAGGVLNACNTGAVIAGDAVVPYIAKNAFGGVEGPCIPGNPNLPGGPCSAQSTMEIIPRINDILFQDANGETKLSEGRYYFATGGAAADRNIIEVDQFGVVTCVSSCSGSNLIGQCSNFQ